MAVDYVCSLEETRYKLGLSDVTEVFLKDSQILIPGLIDAHIHAPQYPNAGLGYDETLLDWLRKYTFPLENKFTDTEFAGKIYDAIVVSRKKTVGESPSVKQSNRGIPDGNFLFFRSERRWTAAQQRRATSELCTMKVLCNWSILRSNMDKGLLLGR